MKEQVRQHAMAFFLAVQAFLGAISSAMTSEDALWISALAAAVGSQAAVAGSIELSKPRARDPSRTAGAHTSVLDNVFKALKGMLLIYNKLAQGLFALAPAPVTLVQRP
jgi:hypothetical protein